MYIDAFDSRVNSHRVHHEHKLWTHSFVLMGGIVAEFLPDWYFKMIETVEHRVNSDRGLSPQRIKFCSTLPCCW